MLDILANRLQAELEQLNAKYNQLHEERLQIKGAYDAIVRVQNTLKDIAKEEESGQGGARQGDKPEGGKGAPEGAADVPPGPADAGTGSSYNGSRARAKQATKGSR